jgi:quercetin dioxygenase-like cupin family protein
MTKLPENMPKLEELLINTASVPWREKSLKGIHEKMLWRNEETGASIALIKFDKGAGIPQPHYHSSNQFMFCLSGRYEYSSTGVVLTAGSFYCNPKGNVHGPAIAREETVWWSRCTTARIIRKSRRGTPMSETRVDTA